MKHLLLILGVLLGVGIVHAQSKDTKNLVANQNFVFKANTVLPMRGSSHTLTSDFDLTISKDAVISYLPYFGRSWQAPADPTKSELDFASHNFGYTTAP